MEYTIPTPNLSNHRYFGGVGILMKPFMVHKLINNVESRQLQFITIKFNNVTVTVAYVSPAAKAQGISIFLESVEDRAGNTEMGMEYFNPWHKLWEFTAIMKGTVLEP